MASLIRQILRPNLYRSTALLNAHASRFYSSEGGATYTKDVLKKLVNTNKVVIFMKGNPEAPRCGFSNAVVQILRMHGVEYDAHDVLASDELRQSMHWQKIINRLFTKFLLFFRY